MFLRPKHDNWLSGKLTFPWGSSHSNIPVPRDQHSLARDELGAIAGDCDGPVLCVQPVVTPDSRARPGAEARIMKALAGLADLNCHD